MGYILNNNKWTPKPTQKIGDVSASKEKTPSGSSSRQKSAKKSLTCEFEGNEMEMGGYGSSNGTFAKIKSKGRQCYNKAVAFGNESQRIEKGGAITKNGQKNNGRRERG